MSMFLLGMLLLSFASAIIRVVVEHWAGFVVLALLTMLIGARVSAHRRWRAACAAEGHRWRAYHEFLRCDRCGQRW